MKTPIWSCAVMFCIFAVPEILAGDPDVQTIIQRSVAASRADYQSAPSFSYKERDREGDGSKTYQVTMLLGSPYNRLIAVDDKPLSSKQLAQQEKSYQEELAQRRSESADQKQKRISAYERDRKRDHEMTEQLTEAFQFKLVGKPEIRSRKVYLLNATPKAGYKPPNMQTQVLTGMTGQLWIDRTTYQWVKVTASVLHPVNIEGFLAQVQPGTSFELEKMPVGDGTWQVKHFSMKSRAKILHVFSRKDSEDQSFSDYRKQH